MGAMKTNQTNLDGNDDGHDVTLMMEYGGDFCSHHHHSFHHQQPHHSGRLVRCSPPPSDVAQQLTEHLFRRTSEVVLNSSKGPPLLCASLAIPGKCNSDRTSSIERRHKQSDLSTHGALQSLRFPEQRRTPEVEMRYL